MNPAFTYTQYLIRRQMLALTGTLRLYSPSGELQLYCQQKMFRLKEDIRVYSDESREQELLLIKARQILDFSAAYDVLDPATGQRWGTLRRRGWRSLLRDEWEVLDAGEQLVGILIEDSQIRALLRRFLLGSWLPQEYDLLDSTGAKLVDFKQRFNLFRYEMDIDFSLDTSGIIDRRLGLAAGVLLAIIEGRQD